MALTTEEKERVRYHLGYLSVDPVYSRAQGYPAASEPLWVVENSMDNVMPQAEAGVRRAIQELDCIEDQMSNARQSLEVSAAGGGVRLRGPEAMRELEEQYVFWSNQLANTLGAPINPYSLTHTRFGPTGPAIAIEPC